ncbi:MAG: chromate efflux transporter [Sphingomicrobium sp.]
MNVEPSAVPFRDALGVWTRVALLSFGGPAGQIAVMHRELVERKRWIDEPQFLHALNFCMLLPGPEAQQLAIYIGWLLNGTAGGVVAGTLFVLPGVIAILALSFVYAIFGHLGPVAALFFGLKSAVLAIVIEAIVRIGRRALKSRLSRLIAVAAFVSIFFFAVPFPVIVGGAALIGLVNGRPPQLDDSAALLPARRRPLWLPLLLLALWLLPLGGLLAFAGRGNAFTEIALFFSRMAVVTFGGAYAVLAYVAQQAVGHYHWLTAPEMLDGLGMAETTPGPLIMVTQFVGFIAALRNPGSLPPLLAASLGALLTTWVTFVPCFLWIFLGAPYVERLRGNAALSAALAAVTAAVVGVILNLAIWFAVHSLFGSVRTFAAGPLRFDAPVLPSIHVAAALLAGAATLAILRMRVAPMLVLAASAATGVAISLAGFA